MPAAVVESAALRAAWDSVLSAVKSKKRTAHAQLADAQVVTVEGRTLVLAFQHPPILRQFTSATGPDVLKEALAEALGVDLDIRCVPHDSLGPHRPGSTAEPRPAPPPGPAGAWEAPRVPPASPAGGLPPDQGPQQGRDSSPHRAPDQPFDPSAPLAAAAAYYEGFAQGDEPRDEDPDAAPDPSVPRGEEAALRLVADQLGGRVVHTSQT